ncbi:MAG: hypothetical protein PUD16_05910 [bacterium]|nr:hypothetical protein [bacterium]
MLNTIWGFLKANWIDLLLIFVGASALLIYWLQERRKISDAASLIVTQVEELQKSIREIGSYIVDKKLNEGAFYESQTLYKTDYWNQYKHYFIKRIDAYSFNIFDEFYNCASEVLEQQQLMKNLQKNSFFLTQQMLMQMESQSITQTMAACVQSPTDSNFLIQAARNTIPQDMDPAQKAAIENFLQQFNPAKLGINYDLFWNTFNTYKGNLHSIINQQALTSYIPQQIRISLDNALQKYHSIPIIGCEGYRKLKKIASR